jgi:hypothetical protein
MKLSLLVLTAGKQQGKLLDIKLPQFLVGRDPQCHLRPASPLISKRHCAIIQRDNKVFIRDFGSTNGTFVNDERVEGERELHHDDQLRIGPILLAVRIDASAPSPTLTPAPANKTAPAKTPAPPVKAEPARSSSDTKEDDIVAMLMSLDEGDTASGLSSAGDGIPDGSTIMDIKVPPEVLGSKPADNKSASTPAKPTMGDTRSAAARILDKMTRRPRS